MYLYFGPPSSTVHTTHNEKKSNTDYNALLEKINAVEEKTGRKIGLHYVIPQQVPEYSTTVTEETPEPSKWDIVSPIKTAPLSMLDIAQKSLRSKLDSMTQSKTEMTLQKLQKNNT